MNKKNTFFTRFICKIMASIITMLAVVCLSLLVILLFPERASAAQITRVDAGPYAIDVQMSQGTLLADQPFTILVIPQDRGLHLSGQVVEMPVDGTDAANVYIPFVLQPGHTDILKSELYIPVRGFWHIVLELDGLHGHGSTTIPVVVTAPGAMPIWLAWSIGSLPALGLLWWILRQRTYQRALISSLI